MCLRSVFGRIILQVWESTHTHTHTHTHLALMFIHLCQNTASKNFNGILERIDRDLDRWSHTPRSHAHTHTHTHTLNLSLPLSPPPPNTTTACTLLCG